MPAYTTMAQGCKAQQRIALPIFEVFHQNLRRQSLFHLEPVGTTLALVQCYTVELYCRNTARVVALYSDSCIAATSQGQEDCRIPTGRTNTKLTVSSSLSE